MATTTGPSRIDPSRIDPSRIDPSRIDSWTRLPPDGLRRLTDLAQTGLKAQAVIVFRPAAEPTYDANEAYLRVPIHATDGDVIGTLCAVDVALRVWTEDDRALLVEISACVSSLLELAAKQEATENMRAPSRAIIDNLPGLVFEREKTGPAQAIYTILQSRGTVPLELRTSMERSLTQTDAIDVPCVHQDDRLAVKAALLRNLIEEKDLDLTFRMVGHDGVTRWLHTQSKVRRVDGQTLWTGVCLDVTDLMCARDLMTAEPKTPDQRIVDETHIDQASGATHSLPATAAGSRVLLADDLDLNRKLIADMLSLEGHVVDCVADGAAAVAAAAAKTYDLILMDMIMPGMDGIAATRAIRALPAPAGDVPIVALTANSFPEQLDSCIDAGMDATLTKPMSIDALTRAVSTWTRSRSQAA